MVAAQRRLFPPTKENASPQRKLVPVMHLGINYSPPIYLISELSVVLRLVSSPSTNWHRGRNRLTTERTHLAIRDTSRLFQSMTIASSVCVCMCDVMILILCV